MKKIMKNCLFLPLALIIACATGDSSRKNSPVMKIDVPESQKKVVSISKFDDRSIGTKEYSPWQQGIPDMVMEALGAIPYYKIISREYMMEKVLKEQEFQLVGVTDQKSVVELGKLLNAQFTVIGSFSVFKDSLAINAKVLSIESGEIIAQTSKRGKVDEFYILQNEIAIGITDGMNLAMDEAARKALLARHDTKVVEASLANYRGEEKLEKIQILEEKVKTEKNAQLAQEVKAIKEEAKQDFKKALDYDSAYEKAKKNLSKLSLAIPMTL
jgi:TolB-like protein